jgi:hypothetical protein
MTETLDFGDHSVPSTAQTDDPAEIKPPPPSRGRRWIVWAAPGAALVVGVLAGVGIMAAASDPTTSTQYQALQSSYADMSEGARAARNDAVQQSSRAEAARSSAVAAQSSATAALSEAKASEQALASQQAAVSASAASLSSQARAIQQNTITEGVWVVGTDVQPGHYRTTAAVSGGCYWMITKSGTNGSDIIQNGLPTGGYPTVTLSAGQDFTTQDCGSWVKQ